jgi:excisionase family DNA binding protein
MSPKTRKSMRLVTIKVVAELLMVKPSTLYSWVRKGAIPFHRLNGLVRFDLDEIEAWIQSSESTASANSIVTRKAAGPVIDKLIRQAIDGSKGKAYNPSNGKPGQTHGLRKEV